MKSGDSEKFELNEPAARSHTPPALPIQTIEIVLIDKAPKKIRANDIYQSRWIG